VKKLKKVISIVLTIALINATVPQKAVEASFISDLLGGLFTIITAPIWIFCQDNPTFRKNNPFRKKPWQEVNDFYPDTAPTLSPRIPSTNHRNEQSSSDQSNSEQSSDNQEEIQRQTDARNREPSRINARREEAAAAAERLRLARESERLRGSIAAGEEEVTKLQTSYKRAKAQHKEKYNEFSANRSKEQCEEVVSLSKELGEVFKSYWEKVRETCELVITLREKTKDSVLSASKKEERERAERKLTNNKYLSREYEDRLRAMIVLPTSTASTSSGEEEVNPFSEGTSIWHEWQWEHKIAPGKNKDRVEPTPMPTTQVTPIPSAPAAPKHLVEQSREYIQNLYVKYGDTNMSLVENGVSIVTGIFTLSKVGLAIYRNDWYRVISWGLAAGGVSLYTSLPPINKTNESFFPRSLEVIEDNFPNWQKFKTVGSIISIPSALSSAAYYVRHKGYRRIAVGMSGVSIVATAATAVYIVPSIVSFFSFSAGLGVVTGVSSLIWSILPSRARDHVFKAVKGLGIITAMSTVCEFAGNKIMGKSL
jgi:hypothetical protein